MNSMKQTYTEANPGVESLVKDHMELVRKIAWHMHGRVRNAVEIDDLLQVGYFGLVNAAQKYSKKEGAVFSSYAVIRIRGAIVDYLRKSSNLSVKDLPKHLQSIYHVSSQTEPLFWGPVSVKLDSEERLFVTEHSRHRIQIYEQS